MMKKSSKGALVLVTGFLLVFPSITRAQTIYKKDAGFFTMFGLNPVLNIDQSSPNYLAFEPAIGYRFGKHFDIRLHPQFWIIKRPYSNRGNLSEFTLRLVGGYTTLLSDRWQLRAQLAVYEIFQSNAVRYGDIYTGNSPSSGEASLSFYYKMPVSKGVAFYPNAGLVFGYGANTGLYRFWDLVSGIRLGFDTSLKLSSGFYLIISPDIRLSRGTGGSGAEVNIGFNF